MLGNLTSVLMSLVDALLVGKLGAEALAAVSFSSAVIGFFVICSAGFTAAGGVLVSNARGTSRPDECGKILSNAVVVNLLVALIMFICLLAIVFQIDLFDQPEAVKLLAKNYISIIAPSIFFSLFFYTLRGFCEALDVARPMLSFMVFGLLSNALISWVLIFGKMGFPPLGVEGAAWGTLLARFLMASFLLVFVFKKSALKKYLSDFNLKSISLTKIKNHIHLGGPSSLQYMSESGAFSGAAIMMGWVGTKTLAAHQIALNLASMSFMFALGGSIATGIRVSRVIGEKNWPRVRQVGLSGVLLVTGIMSMAALIFYFGRFFLPRLYIADIEVIEIASTLLVVAALFQLFDGLQAVLIGALRGAKDVLWPTIISIVAHFGVSIPFGYFLAFSLELGGKGIWFGLISGLVFSSIFLGARFWRITQNVGLR